MRLSTILGLAATATSAFAFIDYDNIHTHDVSGLYDRDVHDGYSLYARDPDDYEALYVGDVEDLYELYARGLGEKLKNKLGGKELIRTRLDSQSRKCSRMTMGISAKRWSLTRTGRRAISTDPVLRKLTLST
ncbi:hypothetical protein MMC34_002962 [Xylographa carneopallida]|nr:hypothetical protein [Xylographa carneopallida]